MSKNKNKVMFLFVVFLLSTIPSKFSNAQAQEDTWTTLAPMPTPRNGLGATTAYGKIYAIGGSKNRNEEYNPITDTWATKTPMPTGRVQLVTVTVRNKIYAIGGYQDSKTSLTTNEEYDPITNTWTTKASMSIARGEMCANVVNDKIYITGGYAGGGPSNKTEVYDPKTDTWTIKADMPYAVWAHSSAVAYDKIYVLTSPLQIYDIKTDSWSLGSPPPIVQSSAVAVSVIDLQDRELIYSFGGRKGMFESLDLVQIFDPQENEWGVGDSMPTPRSNPAATVVNRQVYVLGGYLVQEKLELNHRYTPLGIETPVSTPSPTPTIKPSITPSPTPDTSQTVFPSAFEIAIIVVVAVFCVGLLVNLAKKRSNK